MAKTTYHHSPALTSEGSSTRCNDALSLINGRMCLASIRLARGARFLTHVVPYKDGRFHSRLVTTNDLELPL
jgi:hypothetical protein